jgi:hypothetical protein
MKLFYGLSRDNNRFDVDSFGPSPNFVTWEQFMKLGRIKRHLYFPFRDFRSSDLSLPMLELYWAELFLTVLTESGVHKAVEKWIPQASAGRMDGNPILVVMDRVSSPLRRLRIMQRFNSEGLVELDLDNPVPVHFSGDAYEPFVPGLTYGATDDDAGPVWIKPCISTQHQCRKLAAHFHFRGGMKCGGQDDIYKTN